MSEPFIGQVIIFAGNFAPRGWAFCDGQLLPIAPNTALFSILGTTYGGDGETTFALPNLKGRAVMHPGRGPGLTERRLGQRGGAEAVSLTAAQMPFHTHGVDPDLQAGPAPEDRVPRDGSLVTPAPGVLVDAAAGALATGPAGAGQAHNNMQPFIVLNYIIALQGLYPSE